MKVRDVMKSFIIMNEHAETPLYNKLRQIETGMWVIDDLTPTAEGFKTVVEGTIHQYDTPEQAFIALAHTDYWR